MTTYILDEHHGPGKTILAQKILTNERTGSNWKPYRVKVVETHDFRSERECLAYFQGEKAGSGNSGM